MIRQQTGAHSALIYVALQFMKGLQDYQYIVFGPLLVLLVLFAPQGLAGLWDRAQARRVQARTERAVDHA